MLLNPFSLLAIKIHLGKFIFYPTRHWINRKIIIISAVSKIINLRTVYPENVSRYNYLDDFQHC